MIDDVATGFVVRTAAGDVELKAPTIATPCVPFARHVLRRPNASFDELNAAMDFLHGGMRGYLMGLTNLTEPVEICCGDLVLRRV